MGRDDFHKKRKERNILAKRDVRKSVLIALEDTKSSKYYFKKLLSDKKLVGKVIFATHIGTDPQNVIKAIIEHKNKSKKEYEKSWVVFDVDNYSANQVNGAIASAKSQNICVAVSNEAYELWILLHFENLTKFTNRKQLTNKVNAYFKKEFKKEYLKSSQEVYEFIIGKQETAIKNAKSLVKMHKKNNGDIDIVSNNPITFIYELVEYLNSLNKFS